jgi:hypothetical protein
MPSLHEILPDNISSNPFRAHLNRDSGQALIQPPFVGDGVLEEVSGDVGIKISIDSMSPFGTVVHFDSAEPTDFDKRVDYSFTRLLNALGATISAELFAEYYGNEELRH